MAADVTLLTTRAECDVALASLTQEKGSYVHRDTNRDYADTEADRRAKTRADQLAQAEKAVTYYTATAANLDLNDDDRFRAQNSLISATARRDKLKLSSKMATGPTAYLAEVDDDQIDGQIAVLDAAIQAVTAHKDTLPA